VAEGFVADAFVADGFVARLYSIAVIRYVDVPRELTASFAAEYPAVRGTCNGVPFRGTLVPRGGGCYRLALNVAVRRAAGQVDAGDASPSAPRPLAL
jgi:hypothetical protein